VNPESRRGAHAAAGVEHALRRLGVACVVRSTRIRGDAARLAIADAADVDAVFVLGGDGTVSEVLGALAHGHTPVGVIPCGTGNLLAHALGIPLDPARAAAVLHAGSLRRIDLAMLAGGGCFVVAAGVGIDARMVARTSSALKRRAGTMGYVLVGLAAALRAVRRDPFQARVAIDGVEHEETALSILVVNIGALFGGRVTLAPGTRMDDGYLDVAVYRPRGLWEALRVAWRGWCGRFPEDAITHFYRGSRVSVMPQSDQQFQADGELIAGDNLDARLAPGAALVLVPAEAAQRVAPGSPSVHSQYRRARPFGAEM
jgi:diacylglycerol kinase (ATP)